MIGHIKAEYDQDLVVYAIVKRIHQHSASDESVLITVRDIIDDNQYIRVRMGEDPLSLAESTPGVVKYELRLKLNEQQYPQLRAVLVPLA